MPVEFTPPRRLLNAVMRLRDRMRGKDGGPNMAPHLTVEPVDAVNSDGTYQVRGKTVSATGLAQLEAGQAVTVAWKQGSPAAIVAHQVQRAQFPQAPAGVFPVVEELFYQVRPNDGVPDIYFRNAFECVPLNLPKLVPTASFLNSVPVWGLGQDRFFTNATDIAPPFTGRTFIFKFARPSFQPFDGPGAAGRVTLESVYDGSGDNTPIATIGSQVFSMANQTPPGPASMRQGGSPLLDVNGALIFTFNFDVNFTIGTTPVVPHNPGDLFILRALNFGRFSYPVVYDATNRVVLLSGVAHPDFAGAALPAVPSWTGSFAAAVTWTLQGTFVTDARNTARFPFPPTGITISQYCGVGTTPGITIADLQPFSVVGVKGADRVRGWVAWYGEEYQNWVGQSSVPFGGGPVGTYGFVEPFPDQMPSSCADVGSTFTPARSAAAVRAPLIGSILPIYPLHSLGSASTVDGLQCAATLNHLVWRKNVATAEGMNLNGLDLDAGGSDSEGFIMFFPTLLKPSTNQHLTNGLRGGVGAHGVAIVQADFAYQMDNPRIPFKAGAKVNYFLRFWPFANSGPPPDIDALAVSPDQSHSLPFVPGKDYPEDTSLTSVSKLAALPKGVTIGDTLSGRGFSIQVVNVQAGLTSEFEPIPTK